MSKIDYVKGTKCNSSGSKEKVYEGINIKNNLPKANKTQEVRKIG
jgi:hypothetical protein